MVKRIVSVPLWFVSTWLTYGLVAYFLGLPDSGGAVLGVLVAVLVFLDPTGAFWGTATMHLTDVGEGIGAEPAPGGAS